MSPKQSPKKTANNAPPGGLFALEQCRDFNSEWFDISLQTATDKDCRFGKHTNQYHLLQGYGYPPAQRPFPGAPMLHHHSLFNMPPSLQPTTIRSQGYPSYGPQWQGYDLQQSGHGGSQMILPPRCPGQEPSSPGAPRVLLGLLGNNPVNRPTSSSTTPPPGRPPISFPTKWF